MNKWLSDSEILKWNDRLKGLPYMVFPKYGSQTSYPMIIFKQINTNQNIQGNEVITLDPNMKMNFSFSVAKNRVDNFFHIFNKWFSDRILTKTYYQDSYNKEKISDITYDESIIKSKSEANHKVKEKEYTKFTYNFEGRLSSIMAYVMFIEDAIDIFSNIYSYDEIGNEHILTKFTIGDIVSKVDNKSQDYIILDYFFRKIDRKFVIEYEVSEIVYKGQVIMYGNADLCTESELTWSRNNRIDDILEDGN